MSAELEKYKRKLARAEEKIRILENMIEDKTRELYLSNEKLRRQNQEMEQFAYITSHDLQEPLQTIAGFTELLSEYKDNVDENAVQYFRFIREATTRMSALIKGLLEFSVIGKEQNFTKLDCNKILENVLADMDSLIRKSGAKVHVDHLPVIHGVEVEIRQLFQNLIHNAIKFRAKERDPVIHVRSGTENGMLQFSVADNGIGIDPEMTSRVFRIFQRLHTRDEYEGTGIGLANCKKIVEHHGGEIVMTPNPHGGTVVRFTLQNHQE